MTEQIVIIISIMIEMTITKSTSYINIFIVTDEEVKDKKFDEDNC